MFKHTQRTFRYCTRGHTFNVPPILIFALTPHKIRLCSWYVAGFGDIALVEMGSVVGWGIGGVCIYLHDAAPLRVVLIGVLLQQQALLSQYLHVLEGLVALIILKTHSQSSHHHTHTLFVYYYF